MPLPGEIMLVTASLLSSRQELDISPVWIGISASTGAIIGDTIGYFIGRRVGKPLFDQAGPALPEALQPRRTWPSPSGSSCAGACTRSSSAGSSRCCGSSPARSPGALKMPYYKFLAANIAGGIVWAGGTTAAVYFLGVVAETWLKRFSWIGLVACCWSLA